MTSPAVRCSYTRLVALKELKPNPRNPNKHSPEQINLYRKLVEHHGIRRPITVSKLSGLIVTGHGLYETLRTMGATEAPIDEQEFASAADEWAHLLADNRLDDFSELDQNIAAELEREIKLADLNLELAGIFEPEAEHPVQLVEVATQAPPKMTWVLLGISTTRYGEIAETVEKLARIENIICETTSNDGRKED